MAELSNNQKVGAVVGVLMLVAFGGSMFLDAEQVANSYYCPLTEQVVIDAVRLSSSMKTAYILEEDGSEKSISCRSGRTYAEYMPLAEYAESQGLTVDEFLQSAEPEIIESAPVEVLEEVQPSQVEKPKTESKAQEVKVVVNEDIEFIPAEQANRKFVCSVEGCEEQ